MFFRRFFRFSSAFFTNSSFNDLKLNPQLKEILKNHGYNFMTPVQSRSLPEILNHKNCLVLSETGSGKTFCYAIPIINSILENKSKAIILAPSKELCSQIYANIRKIDPSNKIRVCRTGPLTYKAPIIKFLEKQPEEIHNNLDRIANQNIVNILDWKKIDILISTPVQLDILLKLKELKNPKEFFPKFLVIDELDLLLGDQVYAESTRNIINNYYKSDYGQAILCGASIMYKIDDKPAYDTLGDWFNGLVVVESNDFHKLPKSINHEIIDLDKVLEINRDKSAKDLLIEQIKKHENEKIIVFCNSSETAENLNEFFESKQISCVPFFAKMKSDSRTISLIRFQLGEVKILITTDLASRGLDFEDVNTIIQFDFPKDIITLLHRFGRTARAGKSGNVISFKVKNDDFLIDKLKTILEKNEKFDTLLSHKRNLKKNSLKKSV